MSDKLNKRVDKLIEKIDKENPIKTLELSVNIEPEPASRPRFTRRGFRVYNPREDYFNALKEEFEVKIDAMGGLCIEGPVEMWADVYITPPKNISDSEVKSEFARRGLLQPTTRPDIDNYEKAILDCLSPYTMKDDALVVTSHCSKYYAINREPGIDIKLEYRLEKLKFR